MSARTKVGQFREVDLRDAGTVYHDDCAQPRDAGWIPPERQIDEAVGADKEEEIIPGMLSAHRFKCFDAVVRSRPSRLDLGSLKRLMSSDSDPCHFQAMS